MQDHQFDILFPILAFASIIALWFAAQPVLSAI